jgi:protein phosphatase
MKVGMVTHVGKVRETNEDSMGRKGTLLVLADGMGGCNAGEVASALVVERVLAIEAKGPEFMEVLPLSLNNANRALLDYASLHQECSGMGTTVAIVKVEIDRIYVAHVGDSRVYQWHEGILTQLTTDHSLVEELVRRGGITKEQAKDHPQKNVLTRALGTPGNIEVECTEHRINKGDLILLCTDGLTSMLDNDEIASILALGLSPQESAEALVQAANEKGGIDNISVIIAQV